MCMDFMNTINKNTIDVFTVTNDHFLNYLYVFRSLKFNNHNNAKYRFILYYFIIKRIYRGICIIFFF